MYFSPTFSSLNYIDVMLVFVCCKIELLMFIEFRTYVEKWVSSLHCPFKSM